MPEGSAGAPAPRLQAIEDSYEIIGQLRGSEHARRYIGRRREDRANVVITVVTPPGGQGTELSHFAADAQLLAGERHPHLVDVLDARWLDNTSLALVTRRVDGTTLADLLDRGEQLSNPRIAAILRDVYSVLDWARTRGVVHRGVSADGLIFEQTSQRVLVALSPTPIPMTGVADACGDARTVGALAWSMLAGQRYSPENKASLEEIAPSLARRVVDATTKLLGCQSAADAPDVATMIGIVAAGDVLKQAEVEIAAMKEEYEEQHRAELNRCENRRIEVEQNAAEAATALADERADFERRMVEERQAFEAERAEFDRVMAERKEQFTRIRETLEQQASELEQRLAEFDARRTEFEDMILERQREAVEAGNAPDFVLTSTTDRQAAPAKIRGAFAPLDAPSTPANPEKSRRRRWWIPATAVALAAAVVAAVVGVRVQQGNASRNTVTLGKTQVVPTAPRLGSGNVGRSGFLTQSVGGEVVSRKGPVFPAPRRDTTQQTTSADSIANESESRQRRSDSANDDNIGPRSLSAPNTRASSPEPSARDSAASAAREAAEQATRERDTATRTRDTVVRGDTMYIRGAVEWRSKASVDSMGGYQTAPPRQDSGSRPETVTRDVKIGKPDTVRIRPPE
jgi:hypothetical protein